MNNQYLEVLQLAPGATKPQIKRAYRELSKRYHPDVSKDENAREKFIEINEAYKFLTAVGPRPLTIESSAQAYDYDIHNRAYEEWRRRARAFARRKAREAARRQNALIKSLLKGFNVFLIFIVSFNILLVMDSHMGLVAFDGTDSNENRILKSTTSYYDVVLVNNHTVHLKRGALDPLRKIATYENATVYATPIFDKPLFLDLVIRGKTYRFTQYAGVYGFFEGLIQGILLLALLYKVLFRSLDAQLTMTILLSFLSIFQLYIFLKY